MRKLGVLVVHGMGSQEADFADGMIAEVSRRLRRRGLDPDAVAWQPAWWAPVLSGPQRDLWDAMVASNDLDLATVRRFVLGALGDAVAYRRVPGRSTTYDAIHAALRRAIADLRAATRQGRQARAREVPLVILAHSLGGHIASNYAWDLQRGRAPSRGNPFEDLETLTAITTFGCNLPLFTLAHDPVVPIDFPRPVTRWFPRGTPAAAVRRVARWHNYYDPDDVLGWPLRPLSPAYARAVHADVAINVGGALTSWNPAAHTRYWTDDDFTKPVARALGDILALL